MKKIFTLVLACIGFNFLFAQSDSCHLRISLLTCTPGFELYSTFGHSALRVTDSSASTDIIYNYGTFDFDDPNFYSKFTRGKLLYFVSIDKFGNFLQQYEYEQRGITEQILHLSCSEKEKLVAALRENAKEENKYYKYDFVYDNCTTRLRDIVFANTNGAVETKNIRSKNGVSFRNLIHEYLDKSYQYWSKLGIDILLGSPLDKKLSNSEAMFLPDYLLKGFDSTKVNGVPLVSEKKQILKPTLQSNKSPLLSPFGIFAILFIVIALLSVIKSTDRFLAVFDFFLFFFCGALGILILFMWFGTDHQTCRNNFNLVWAFPFHFFVVFFIFKKPDWLRYYFLVNAIVLVLLLITWKWLPQEMNNALLPIICLLILRSVIRYKNLNYAGRKNIRL
ncbi:MAG TPA: DUF4105 domain-containing protein [Chitinophagaceae bacterium]|nr:DUF4105 domain-containing protein [Chitinophagaceae bacterium]